MASAGDEGALPLPELAPPPRVLIVAAPFYRDIANLLIAGARAVLDETAARHDLVEVPGALEIAPAIRLAAGSGAYEGFVALGCVIRGETSHYETVCAESARGLTLLATGQGLAIGNGILTCETIEQARMRATPLGADKGGGAATAALHLIALARRFRARPDPETPAPDDDEILLAAAKQPRTA